MKKTLMWVCAILGISLCFLGGFGLGKYFSENQENRIVGDKATAENNENKTDEIELSKADKTKLKEIIDIIPVRSAIINPEKDLENNEKLGIAMALSENTDYKGTGLKKILEENFGSDLNVELENIKCDCGTDFYIYDSKTDTYKENANHGGHGAMVLFDVDNHIENYEIVGNAISVKVSKVFYPDGGPGPISGYYLSYDDAVKFSPEGGNTKEMPKGNSEDYFDRGLDYFEEVRKLEKDNLPIYTYIFEKVGDNFVFKGYELSK